MANFTLVNGCFFLILLKKNLFRFCVFSLSKPVLTFILFFLNACQTLQDGLAGNKNKNSDEFLIEKKNPLILPPEFSKLPEPRKNKKDEVFQDDNIDLTKVLETNDGSDEQTLPSDLEKSIQNILKKK